MQVKEALLQKDNLVKVLEYYGYCNIKETEKDIRCGIKVDSNPTSILITKNEQISTIDFARNVNGDIFTLIMEQKCKKYNEVISDIKSILGIEITFKSKTDSESIARCFKDIIIKKKEQLDVYAESILNDYKDYWSVKFLKDGISINTQKKFNIRFDEETNRIVIPHRTSDGEICGLMGRANYKIYGHGNKYLPLISHKKSETLFGYSQNYSYLYNADVIYVGESEKFVMQLDSMSYFNAVALSGSGISKTQCQLIAKLMPKKVVFCYDEGLDESVIYRNINKFKMFTEKMNIKTKLIIDRKNIKISKGSKCSPTDLGKETWEYLVENCCEDI